MEISWAGKEPVKLSNGEERTFLQNGDTLIMRGYAEKDGYF
jgi:fumarylacetoacetase